MTAVAVPSSSSAVRRAALVVVAWLAGIVAAVVAVKLAQSPFGGVDAHAYWLTGQEPLTYGRAPQARNAFLYSPLFADAIRPLTLLPWPVFWAVWAALEGAVLVWLLRPLPAIWAGPVFLTCTVELAVGNVYLLLAAAAVIGVRRPVGWLFPILTKVTLGVGLLWFAARGEWRRLAVAAGTTAALVGVSVLLQPDAWLAWLRMLSSHTGGTRDGLLLLAARCLAAAAVVIVAARVGRPWLLVVAVLLANPVTTFPTLTVLAAVPRLSRWSSPTRSHSTVSPASRPTRSLSTP